MLDYLDADLPAGTIKGSFARWVSRYNLTKFNATVSKLTTSSEPKLTYVNLLDAEERKTTPQALIDVVKTTKSWEFASGRGFNNISIKWGPGDTKLAGAITLDRSNVFESVTVYFQP